MLELTKKVHKSKEVASRSVDKDRNHNKNEEKTFSCSGRENHRGPEQTPVESVEQPKICWERQLRNWPA
jgi:hypothetical protein